MSIAFEMTRGANSMHHGMLPFMGVFDGDRERTEEEDSCSSSSSIGGNSDEDSGDETEVQNSCKGPLDSMGDLEEVLPIKGGMSKFYSGRSKSFTSLSDATSASSIKDFAKPENSYNKKSKNPVLHRDKNRHFPPKANEGGLSKRPSNTCRGTLAHGPPMSCSRSNNMGEDFLSVSSSSPSCLPPLYMHTKKSPGDGVRLQIPRHSSPWRSFSLSDLQAAASATPNH